MRKFLILILVAVGLAGCSSKSPSGPKENQPPETHLFLANSVDTTYGFRIVNSVVNGQLVIVDTIIPNGDTLSGRYFSLQVLHWYGDDTDGEVIGYQWAWNDNIDSVWWLGDSSYTYPIANPDSIEIDTSWTFTSLVADTFYVPIRDTMGYFSFFVRAIDNDSALDATPAKMTFPIINSPPEVKFPFAFTRNYDTAYFVSLNYMTFNWDGGDLDGDLTIMGYDYYLGDSSMRVDDLDTVTWNHLDSLTTRYTFRNLQPGFYRFFLRCRDIAAAYSPIIFYPDTIRGKWEVKPTLGNILYIDDNEYSWQNADSVFIPILDSLYPGGYTRLNFERRTFFNTVDIDSTLSQFDILVWNAGSERHFAQATNGIIGFLLNGGHLMTNVTYSSRDTSIYPFMPIDSVYRTDIFRPWDMVIPGGTDTITNYPGTIQIYPDTLHASNPLSFTFAFKPAEPIALSNLGFGSGYEVLYVTTGDTVAVRFPAYDTLDWRPAKVILFSFAVFDCNTNGAFKNMYSNILQYEFR